MKVNPLSAAIGFVLIDHDLEQARGRRAVNTATPADPSAIGPHLAPGELPCSGGKDCPDHSRSGNEGGSGHV
jgi:hypothetical protein